MVPEPRFLICRCLRFNLLRSRLSGIFVTGLLVIVDRILLYICIPPSGTCHVRAPCDKARDDASPTVAVSHVTHNCFVR